MGELLAQSRENSQCMIAMENRMWEDSQQFAGFEARLSLMESNLNARLNNVENEVSSLESAIRAVTVTVNALNSFAQNATANSPSFNNQTFECMFRRLVQGSLHWMQTMQIELVSLVSQLDAGFQVRVDDLQ